LSDLDAQQHLRASYAYDIDILSLIMYSHQTTFYASDRERDFEILDGSDPKNIKDYGFDKINTADIAFASNVACMARGRSRNSGARRILARRQRSSPSLCRIFVTVFYTRMKIHDSVRCAGFGNRTNRLAS